MDLSERTTRTGDDLPYTDEFKTLYPGFLARSGVTMTRHDIWKPAAGCQEQSNLVQKVR